MEDAIVNNPEMYINEKGLRLLARQYKIGSYIFDLLFEDRHGGKLIVELQRGTLDRTHTYKILDYYHEYKEKNPQDFIDVMVIANIVPPERKRRLRDLAIDYREIPVNVFVEPGFETSNDEHKSILQPNQNIKEEMKSDDKKTHFQHFIKDLHDAFNDELRNTNDWSIGDEKLTLSARHKPTEKILKEKFKVEIWVARLDYSKVNDDYGKVRCSFEIAVKENVAEEIAAKEKVKREKIADKLRELIGLEEGILESKGSTMFRVSVDIDNGIKEEISKIIDFYRFLNKRLLDQNKIEDALKDIKE